MLIDHSHDHDLISQDRLTCDSPRALVRFENIDLSKLPKSLEFHKSLFISQRFIEALENELESLYSDSLDEMIDNIVDSTVIENMIILSVKEKFIQSRKFLYKIRDMMKCHYADSSPDEIEIFLRSMDLCCEVKIPFYHNGRIVDACFELVFDGESLKDEKLKEINSSRRKKVNTARN